MGDGKTWVAPPGQALPSFQSVTDSCLFAPDPALSFSGQFSTKWLHALCSWRWLRLKSPRHLPMASAGISCAGMGAGSVSVDPTRPASAALLFPSLSGYKASPPFLAQSPQSTPHQQSPVLDSEHLTPATPHAGLKAPYTSNPHAGIRSGLSETVPSHPHEFHTHQSSPPGPQEAQNTSLVTTHVPPSYRWKTEALAQD